MKRKKHHYIFRSDMNGLHGLMMLIAQVRARDEPSYQLYTCCSYEAVLALFGDGICW